MTFPDESAQIFVGRFLLPEEIGPWIEAQTCTRKVWGLCTHHTYSPGVDTWRGRNSLMAVYNWYATVKGWSKGVGPHFFIGPHQRWLTSPVGVWVATHFARTGIHVAGYNLGSIGTEYVWDGDRLPFPASYLRVGALLHQALSRKLGVPLVRTTDRTPGLFFHRDHAAKSCPGNQVLHTDVFAAYRQQEDNDMTPEQDALLRTLSADILELRKSARASSFRESIMIAVSVGDYDTADRLDADAKAAGYVTGYRRPQ